MAEVPAWISGASEPMPPWLTGEQSEPVDSLPPIPHKTPTINIEIIDELKPFLSPSRYKVAYGGRGCIHEDTKIDTPSGQVRVADFKGGEVYSLSRYGVVVAIASTPVRYPVTPMYKVTMENGYSITVTAEHKFLTKTAWKPCHEIDVLRDEIYVASPQQTMQGIFPSGSAEGVLHYSRIILNYLYGCLMGYHPCDVLPHQESDTVQDVLPLLADAAGRMNRISTHKDVLESVQIHNLVYQLLCHLSSRDVLPVEGGTDCALMENCISPKISAQFSDLLQLCQQSPERIDLVELVQVLCDFFQDIADESWTHQEQNLLVIQLLLQRGVDDSSYSDSLVNNLSLQYTTAASIEQVEDAEYYDLHVHQYHNYLTNGIVNHNSSKSWGIARMLIARAYARRERILCCREFQGSIGESVLALLESQIQMMGLTKAFEIQAKKITCLTSGSVFLFEGLKSNVTKIKSMEGITLVWAEEAEKIQKNSWDVLIPTIRQPGSEIWISFNPDDDLDETYVRFVEDPPPDCYSVLVNYHLNPWFPEVLRKEMEYLKNKDYSEYEHVWEGKPRAALLGAYYTEQMLAAHEDKRIGNIPHDETIPVQVSFDLGMADSMVLWFAQRVGTAVMVIDCWEYKGTTLSSIIKDIERSDYRISQVVLPHDGKVQGMISGLRRHEVFSNAGYNVTIAPGIHEGVGVDDGIRATKAFLKRCYFDKTKCADGIKALKRYRTKYNEERKVFSNTPHHDWTSDFADSFRYLAVTEPEVEFNTWGTGIDYNENSKHI